jgi:hypothetical protein
MNPYLEQDEVAHDFHQSFLPVIREALLAQVRPHYVVKLEEHLFIYEFDDERRFLGRGDVSISETEERTSSVPRAVSIAAPAYAQLPPVVDVEHHSYLEIRDRHSRESITVIKL